MKPDPSRDSLAIPPALLAEIQTSTIREKIAQGLASARQGKLVDGPSVFARIRAEMAEIERQRDRPTSLASCNAAATS